MRCACIDIGSNTTRLLVAEPEDGRLREVAAERVFTMLGGHGGRIAPDKLAEVAAVVGGQVRTAQDLGASSVHVVATAAVRAAANAAELCTAVEACSGERVRILSGADEARLAFLGATRTLPVAPDGPVAVVDVGGGSTEIVGGTASGGVEWSVSLPIGSAVLANHHQRHDPPAAQELWHARRHVARVFAGLRAPDPAPLTAYAVGGSAASLGRLVGLVLDHPSLRRAVALMVESPSALLAQRFGLHPERARVLPAGLLILDAASTALDLPLQISGGGLREGVIMEQISERS